MQATTELLNDISNTKQMNDLGWRRELQLTTDLMLLYWSQIDSKTV